MFHNIVISPIFSPPFFCVTLFCQIWRRGVFCCIPAEDFRSRPYCPGSRETEILVELPEMLHFQMILGGRWLGWRLRLRPRPRPAPRTAARSHSSRKYVWWRDWWRPRRRGRARVSCRSRCLSPCPRTWRSRCRCSPQARSRGPSR